MRKTIKSRLTRCSLAAAVCALPTFAAVAACQQDSLRNLSLSQRSILTLGAVHTVVLEFEPMPESSAAGVDTAGLRIAAELKLREHGIAIAGHEGAPARIYVNIELLNMDRESPTHMWVYRYDLEVQELATPLLHPSLQASVTTFQPRGGVGYAPAEQLTDVLQRALSGMLDEFLNAWLNANPPGSR